MVARALQIKPGRSPDARVNWMGPMPLWARPGPAGIRIQETSRANLPAILRFDHDDFIQEYLDTVAAEPERLGEWIAQPETWRNPMRNPGSSSQSLQTEAQPTAAASRVEFLFERTHKLTQANKPSVPAAIGLQTGRELFRKPVLPLTAALDEELLPLKLYQAGQQRHYLVSASLICHEPGLPDCEPQITQKEKVGFVIRRLLPPDADSGAALRDWEEYAFVAASPGSQNFRWQRIGRHSAAIAQQLVAGEELLPMFPVAYTNSCAQSRRLHTGTIPVSRREKWVGAEVDGVPDNDAVVSVERRSVAPRLAVMLLQTDVLAPWKMLLEQAEVKNRAFATSFDISGRDEAVVQADRLRLLRTSRDEFQTGSWYVLLDLSRFLKQYLPAVWQVIKREQPLHTLDAGEQALALALSHSVLPTELAWELVTASSWQDLSVINRQALSGAIRRIVRVTPGALSVLDEEELEAFLGDELVLELPGTDNPYNLNHLAWTLDGALVAVDAQAARLESAENFFSRFSENGAALDVDNAWPDSLFTLADASIDAPLPVIDDPQLANLEGLALKEATIDALGLMIERLLPAADTDDPLLDVAQPGDAREAWFVIRCVYQRPECGALFTPLVSAASQRFQMAPFFDPDAPSRPVRIPMPMDISPAGLRKFQKNTGFIVSDLLCGKIKGIRKMSLADLVLSVLPWPFHKDLPNLEKNGPCKEDGNGFGMICSFSIPIVTLCALVLMMIMVALFDVIFRWIPYLFVCLPIPGLKGKGQS